MALEGITGSPYKHPEVRRKIPKAYARPSISVGGSGPVYVKRSWKDTPVTQVVEHDTVAEFGIVAEVSEVVQERGDMTGQLIQWVVQLHNVMGEHRDYPGQTRVFAFTADPA